MSGDRPSTQELVARIMALEAGLKVAQAQLKPQTMRQRLERTIDPRGGEPRIMDAAGFTLDYAPTIQFTGDATVALNAPERRIEVGVDGGGGVDYAASAGLVWSDDFAADQLATEYNEVSGFTVSGGALVVPSGASNLLRYGPAYQTAQLIKLTAPGTVTGAVDEHVYVQVRVCGSTLDTSVGLRYLPAYNGAPGGTKATLTVATRTAGAAPVPIGSNAYGAVAHPVSTAYWLMLIATGVNDLMAYVFDVDPLTNTTTAPIIANGVNGYTFPHPQRALGAPVGIVCSMPTGWTIDDYKVWNV